MRKGIQQKIKQGAFATLVGFAFLLCGVSPVFAAECKVALAHCLVKDGDIFIDDSTCLTIVESPQCGSEDEPITTRYIFQDSRQITRVDDRKGNFTIDGQAAEFSISSDLYASFQTPGGESYTFKDCFENCDPTSYPQFWQHAGWQDIDAREAYLAAAAANPIADIFIDPIAAEAAIDAMQVTEKYEHYRFAHCRFVARNGKVLINEDCVIILPDLNVKSFWSYRLQDGRKILVKYMTARTGHTFALVNNVLTKTASAMPANILESADKTLTFTMPYGSKYTLGPCQSKCALDAFRTTILDR